MYKNHQYTEVETEIRPYEGGCKFDIAIGPSKYNASNIYNATKHTPGARVETTKL